MTHRTRDPDNFLFLIAIDIWAVGIMLLSVLCHKFPIFNSSDDVEALMEIGAMFGPNSLAKCAFLHSTSWIL